MSIISINNMKNTEPNSCALFKWLVSTMFSKAYSVLGLFTNPEVPHSMMRHSQWTKVRLIAETT